MKESFHDSQELWPIHPYLDRIMVHTSEEFSATAAAAAAGEKLSPPSSNPTPLFFSLLFLLPPADPAMHKQNILFLLSSLNKDFFISFPEWRIGEGEGVAEGRAHHTLPTTLSAPSILLSFGGASSLSGSKDSKSALKEWRTGQEE